MSSNMFGRPLVTVKERWPVTQLVEGREHSVCSIQSMAHTLTRIYTCMHLIYAYICNTTAIFIYSTNTWLLPARYNEHCSVSALQELTVLSLFLPSFLTKSKWLNPSPILETIFSESLFPLCFFVSPLGWLIRSCLSPQHVFRD